MGDRAGADVQVPAPAVALCPVERGRAPGPPWEAITLLLVTLLLGRQAGKKVHLRLPRSNAHCLHKGILFFQQVVPLAQVHVTSGLQPAPVKAQGSE